MAATRPVARLLGALLWLAAGTGAASGLQVAPVSLTLPPGEHGQALWLSNSGDVPLHAQVRVYRWQQRNGQESLEPTRDLVASPPMIEIDPGQTQLVRVVRPGAPPSGSDEAAYRLLINELPLERPEKSGVDFVMEYSLPVFLAPSAPTRDQLHWSLVRVAGGTKLRVSNAGNGHARLSALSVEGGSGRREVADGLLGYVLPGATMEWDVPPEAAAALLAGGTLRATINGRTVDSVALADRPD